MKPDARDGERLGVASPAPCTHTTKRGGSGGCGSESGDGKGATAWSFTWRVLQLFGRQLTFLCSLNLLRLPFVCLYYFYVWMPLFFLALFLKYALVVLQVSSRRSSSCKRLVKHYIAFHKTIINIIRKIRRSSLSELTEWILTTVYEVVFTIFDESEDALHDVRNPLHFAELIGYMELEEPHSPQQRRRDKRMRHTMHHHVPSRPFRASVRIVHSPAPPSRRSSNGSRNGGSSALNSSFSSASATQQQQQQQQQQQSLTAVTSRWLRGKRRSWLRGGGGSTDTDYLGALSSGSFSYGFRSGGGGGGHLTADTATCCSASDQLWSEGESVSRTSVPRSPGVPPPPLSPFAAILCHLSLAHFSLAHSLIA
jgi:hypothetical protein